MFELVTAIKVSMILLSVVFAQPPGWNFGMGNGGVGNSGMGNEAWGNRNGPMGNANNPSGVWNCLNALQNSAGTLPESLRSRISKINSIFKSSNKNDPPNFKF